MHFRRQDIKAKKRTEIRRGLLCLLLVIPAALWGQGLTGLPQRDDLTISRQPDYDSAAILQQIRAAAGIKRTFPDSALPLLEQALEQSKEAGYGMGIILSLNHLGNLYQDRGAYEAARSRYILALRYCSMPVQNRKYLATLTNNIGNTYNYQGKFEQAAQSYYQSIVFAEHFSATMSVSSVYSNLAMVLFQMKKKERALYYLDKAEAIAHKENNYAALTTILANKGLYYSVQKAYDESERYLRAAIGLGKKYHQYTVCHNALINLSSIYLARNMPEQALACLREASSLSLYNINAFNLNGIDVAFGRAYGIMRQYGPAERHLQKALRRAEDLNSESERGEAEQLLAEIYALNGNYKSAYRHLRSYMALNDSLQSREVVEDVNRLEVKYRTLEKDRELLKRKLQINLQEKRLAQHKLWILAGTLIPTVLLTGIYFHYRNKQKLQQERIRNMQQEQEISQLRAMMKGEEKERGRLARDLHDGIGGMLAAIKMNLSATKDKKQENHQAADLSEIMQMVQETAEEVRRTAHNLMPDILIRHTLQDALILYCDNINSGGGVQVDIQFNGDTGALDKSMELILYRITQELIQNIVKHAHASFAEIQITRHENRLSLTVEDNGTGFDPGQIPGGIGLQNLQFRVLALNGYISIDSGKGKGTTVYIEFDLGNLEKPLND